MPNVCVAIKSCHKHAARRKAVSETWLPELDWADAFFIVGAPRLVIPDSLSCAVSDAFADIAPKVQYACRYALENNIDFMFVCDDDTYVRPERLARSSFEKHDYCGFLRTSGLDYNGGIPYAQGSAYWMSRRAMEIVATSPVMTPGVIDDGAVGRALDGRVAFTHDRRYEPGPEALYIRPENNLISTHKALPDTMYRLHKVWSTKNGLK